MVINGNVYTTIKELKTMCDEQIKLGNGDKFVVVYCDVDTYLCVQRGFKKLDDKTMTLG